MNQLRIFPFYFLVGVLFFSGCNNTVVDNKAVRTTIEGDGEFPESIVGIWGVKTGRYKDKWAIKFEPGGSISKISHSLGGPITVAEGGVYKEGPDEGTYFLLTLGPCEAIYEPKSRMLEVKIFTEYYEMKLPNGLLKGRAEDYFSREVSKDGKTWTADWRNHTWIDGASPPPIDVIDANPVKLVFERIDIE